IQAEDGIRDLTVTGVQTCALPICRGTPRVANRLLKRVRDYAEVRHAGAIGQAIATSAHDLLEIDEEGLDRLDREILSAIVEKFRSEERRVGKGCRVGWRALCGTTF